MATRHHAREMVVALLYAHDVGNPGVDRFKEEMLEEKKIRNKQKDFALNLYAGVLKNREEIDAVITGYLKEWEFGRLDLIDRAILRLGVYELLYGDLDKAIIINEAVELAKTLGGDQSPKFVNGVLDAVKKGKGEGQ